MESFILPLLEGIVAGVVAAGALFFIYHRNQRRMARDLLSSARQDAGKLVSDASAKAEIARESILRETREEGGRLRKEIEEEVRRRREEHDRYERRIEEREKTLDKRGSQLETRERELTARQSAIEERATVIDQRTAEADRLVAEQRARLERIAGLSAEEARREVLQRAEDEARAAAAALGRDIREQARKSADRDAKRVVAMAIQRISAEHTAESTVAAVTLPSDEMKGRIIGREGRNIRAFEMATGVDVIIDDTPDTVIISCFDPIRREIARRALASLIVDGRIHPGRIEELVAKAKKELDGEIQELGEQAAYDTGIAGLHAEMIKLIGRMKYRTSYGQNILEHSKEVAWLAGMMAAELKLDVNLAKRGALLHDVGKVLTYEHEGTHVELGVEMARKYGESAAVINCIQAHHDDVPHESTESVLVQAADAISGSRPGARREAFESYVKRLTSLEEIASSYPGVEKANAIQAGREIRVVVTPEKIDDNQAAQLSETIAKRIEGELQYPGQIRVVVIRETRAVGVAK
ncbi:MAG TPA: ribonuclease Y [Gemmatimonadales bacterium]|nr:ribonuclease Y [Gemmatimonadales bacterium]